MVTHNPVATEYADRIIHMRDGETEGERVLNLVPSLNRG